MKKEKVKNNNKENNTRVTKAHKNTNSKVERQIQKE
jgi:hypothetical protein